MKKIFSILSLCLSLTLTVAAKNLPISSSPFARNYIEVRVYHFATLQQLQRTDSFFKEALVPALHSLGREKIGVFIAADADTATDKKMYVLIPYTSLKQFAELPAKLEASKTYTERGKPFLNTTYDLPAYTRFESILLYAFEDSPEVKPSGLSSNKKDRIYELRSYESSTEKIHRNKVEMFNKGGEVGLFDRLQFNAVFYGQVMAGSRMPNLMYMTSFENKAARDEHWKQFSSDPFWKTLSAKQEYQHNVSKIDITFLHPTEYSDL